MRGIPKRSTFSVRLAAEEERALRRIARRRKTTVSEVIREAVGELTEREARRPVRPFDMIADLVGSADDLPADLSERTGERFAAIVQENAAHRK